MAMEHREEELQSPASQRLREFLCARQQAWQQGTPEFEQFERELHAHVMTLERECVAAELARYDVAAEHVEVRGVSYQPVLRAAEIYLSAAGPVRVERHLYRPAGHNVPRVSAPWNCGPGSLTATGRRRRPATVPS
jgi:crotonobetainyl-CoA:carnitine CoA-transferase CaiB-like acyl-CoA transferase